MQFKVEHIAIAIALAILAYFVLQQYKPAKKEACCGRNALASGY